MRRLMGDFGVPIAIFLMIVVDVHIEDTYTQVSTARNLLEDLGATSTFISCQTHLHFIAFHTITHSYMCFSKNIQIRTHICILKIAMPSLIQN